MFADFVKPQGVEEDLAMQARVLESMSEGVSLADEDGFIVYTNPAEDRIFGYGPGELIGQHVTVQNAYPPEENARIVAGVIDQLKEKGSWAGEWWNKKKDGTPFWTYARITSLERDGKRYWVCVQEDITERRQAEEALRESEEQYRAVYSQAATGIAEVDMTGRFTRANDRYCEVVGYPREELLGLRFQDITHPDDLPANLDLFGRIAEGPDHYTLEKRYVRKDGRDVWCRTAVSLIRDAAGRPSRVLAIIEDVTERKHAEAALRESEGRFRLLAEVMPQIVWTAAPDGSVDYFNSRWYEYTGLTPETSTLRGRVEGGRAPRRPRPALRAEGPGRRPGREVRGRVPPARPHGGLSMAPGPFGAGAGRGGPVAPAVRHLHRHPRSQAVRAGRPVPRRGRRRAGLARGRGGRVAGGRPPGRAPLRRLVRGGPARRGRVVAAGGDRPRRPDQVGAG